MLVTFPRSIMLDPSGFGDMNQLLTFGLDGPGLNGLGQCTDVDENGNYIPCAAPASGGVADTSNDVTGVLTPTLSLDSLPTLTGSEQTQYTLGVSTPTASTAPIGAQSTVAQDLTAIGPALTAASKALATATGPYAIPGTSYIYNPATGQILLGNTPIGTYNPSTGVASALTSSLLSYLPLIIIAVIGMSFLGGKK